MQDVFGLLFLAFLILLPISIFKPALFQKFIKNTTRKKNAFIFGGLTLLLFTLTGITAPNSTQNVLDVKGTETTNLPTNSPTPIFTPTPTISLTPTQMPTPTIFIPTNTPIPTTFIPSASPTTKPYIPTYTPIPTSPPQIQSQPSVGGWACNCSKTCPEISSCAEAQYQLNSCGCSARDADHDGTACDSAPLHCQN
ncbi:MAG: hypothetical protein AAB521_00925 [Patescibacteria group bacterium]